MFDDIEQVVFEEFTEEDQKELTRLEKKKELWEFDKKQKAKMISRKKDFKRKKKTQ